MSQKGSTTTRREFVKRASAAVAGATLLLGPGTLSAGEEVAPSSERVVFVC